MKDDRPIAEPGVSGGPVGSDAGKHPVEAPAAPALAAPAAILTFWFGSFGRTVPFRGGISEDPSRRRWFAGGPELDVEIRSRFLDTWSALNDLLRSGAEGRSHADPEADGALELLHDKPGAALARILVLDQFSRNLFRGTHAMFGTDDLALAETLRGLEDGVDRRLQGDARAFFYMPLMHAEDKELQKRSVRCFEGLAEPGSDGFRTHALNYAGFARDHQAIVERFGRYPHRNELLGRESTPEELAFLEKPGSSF